MAKEVAQIALFAGIHSQNLDFSVSQQVSDQFINIVES
jgi:hypothetical protein